MSSVIVERYWVDTPEAFKNRITEIVSLHPEKIESFELCKTASGISVPGFRMGQGEKTVFLLGREHGHEAVGTCGLVALMEGLANSKVPGSEKTFRQAEKILDQLTINIFPMLNPDGARRYASQIPNSYPASVLKYCRADYEKYQKILFEPGITLNNPRPSYFSSEEIKILHRIGKPMGTTYTEDGVELWMDWINERAAQTKALKKLMSASKPVLLVDIHAHEHLTTIFTPTEIRREDVASYKKLGSLVYDALEKASIPFAPSKRVGPYLRKDENQSVSWAYKNFGTIQFLYEVDNGYRDYGHLRTPWYEPQEWETKIPTISKEQIVLAVWYGITAILSGCL